MKNLHRLMSGFVLLFLAACNLPQPQADTVRHFTLSGSYAPQATGAVIPMVRLAGHLKSRAMAVRVAENEVAYLEDVRWAEPLDEAITRIVRTRVGPAGTDRKVTILVTHCELDRRQGNQATLSASIEIAGGGADAPVQNTNFTASPRVWDGKDYGTLVAHLQAGAVELGDAVAAALATKP